jgi:hypothetical protein
VALCAQKSLATFEIPGDAVASSIRLNGHDSSPVLDYELLIKAQPEPRIDSPERVDPRLVWCLVYRDVENAEHSMLGEEVDCYFDDDPFAEAPCQARVEIVGEQST